jgi:pilus assembly protein Flp/PilA
MKNLIQRFIREEEGQDLVEYAFLLVFIALTLITILTTVGTSVNTLFSNVNTGIQSS